jgi:hypothetical protein
VAVRTGTSTTIFPSSYMGTELHHRLAVMNSPRSAAQGREARDRNMGQRHRALGLSSKGCELVGHQAQRHPHEQS